MQAIRQRAEQIIAGEYGITYSVPTGKFHRAAPDTTIDAHPLHDFDGVFEVEIGTTSELFAETWMDGAAIHTSAMMVRLGYALTNESTNALYELHDRINGDIPVLFRALSWHENWGGVTPTVVMVIPRTTSVAQRGQQVIAELQFAITYEVRA